MAVLGLALWGPAVASSAVRLDSPSTSQPGLLEKAAASVPAVWLDSLDTGLALATVEYRPVLLLFSSPECGWCQRLKTHVLQDPALAGLLGTFIRVEIDAGTHRETAARYGVRGVPALRVLRADGWVQGGADGFMDAAALRTLLEPALNPEVLRAMQAPARDVLDRLKGTAIATADWPVILEAFGKESLRDEIRERIMQLNPFPGADVVALLAHPRLAVRTGALDLLEALAGSTFGFDPWLGPGAADVQGAALARWQSWAGGVTGKVETVYASLDQASITRLVQDLVSGERERSLRAMRMLGQGGDGVAAALAAMLADAPDLDEGARRRIRAVQYTLVLPRQGALLPPEETAHRLVFGNPDVRLRTLSSLSKLGKRALPILREFLVDPDPMVRETAVEAILAAGQRLALADIGSLLQAETDRHVLHTVLRGLGGVRSRAAMLMLLPFVSHADESLAMSALESLSRLEFRDPAEAVGKALEDSRWRVRAAALETAGKLSMATLADKVVELLRREQDRFVRVTAIRTLAALEVRQSAAILAEWFAQDDALKGPIIAAYAEMDIPLPPAFITAVKGLPDDALLSVVQVLPDAGEQALPLAVALANHPGTDVACVALRLLGAYAGSNGQYMPLVVEALRSGSKPRQLAVLEAVGQRDYYDREATVDFDALVKEDVALVPPQASAVPEGASPVDDLFAAFADPAGGASLAGAEPEQDAAATASVADASPVDDLFADFAAAAGSAQDVAATSAVEMVSAPLAGVTGSRPGLLESLVGMFMPSRSDFGHSSSRSARTAVSWTDFAAAAAPLLASADPDVRLAAALWMGSQGDVRAVSELLADPASRTAVQRVSIARVLARIPHRDGFARLAGFLDDPDASVREQAVEVLFSSRIGMERIFATLQTPGTRLTAADVVSTGSSSYNQEWKEPLRTHALAMVQQPGTEAARNAGLILLSETGDPRDRAVIEPLLDVESPYQRRAAWFALARIDRPRFEALITRVAVDASARVRMTVPAVYALSNTPWIHFLDAETPLRRRHYSDYSSMRGRSRSTFPAVVREALGSLCQDPDAGVRFESLFCLLVNRQPLDLQQLVDAAESLPDRKAAGQRIASFMMSNADELGQAFSVLLPYIEEASYASTSLERLRSRLTAAAGGAGEGDGLVFQPLPARQADARDNLWSVAAGMAPPEVPALHAVFFTKPGCRECQQVEALLQQLRAALPELTVETLEIGRPAAMRLNQVLCGRFRAPTSLAGVPPAVFSGGGYLIRDGFSADSLGALLAASGTIPLAEWRTVGEADEAAAAVAIEEVFTGISVPLLLLYALSDSVNPCAFAAIIFFISYLQVTRRSPREIAQVALAFIVAVFLTYLALGFGIGEALARLSALQRAGKLMNALMALLTLVLALLSLNDARLCARGRMEAMTLQLPALLKRRIHGVIRGNARQPAFVLAAFSTGVVISVLELACTGQAYLPAIHYMLRAGDRIGDAAGYLVLYNLAFVAPLFVIFGLVYRGMRSERMVEWLRRHAAAVKLVSALLFLVLFVILLRQHVLPDWRAWRMR